MGGKPGPEEILGGRGAALTDRLRAATFLQRGRGRRNRGRGDSEPSWAVYVVVEKREEALRVAKRWKNEKGKIWTDGPRLDDGKVGAVAV